MLSRMMQSKQSRVVLMIVAGLILWSSCCDDDGGRAAVLQGVEGRWSASTIIDVAADFLDPASHDDPNILSHSDPLLDDPPKVIINGANYDDENFIVPMLSNSVGDNNQILEYMTAAVIARATKRTLCLTPFFSGPTKHTGHLPTGGLSFEERFDVKLFGKFVKLSSLNRCLHKCNGNIQSFWWLRHSRSSQLDRHWHWDPEANTHDFGRHFIDWTSVNDVRQAVKGFNHNHEEKCVALGGLFPGLRWRGAYLAPSLYMRPSSFILEIANALQRLAIGQDRNFLAVHWRFEESICGGSVLGLCFLRCADGAIIDSGLHAATRGLPTANMQASTHPKGGETVEVSCRHMVDSTRVTISKHDLVSAIVDKAFKENVSSIYIATDGWLRGPHAQSLIREVVTEARAKGVAVSGLWKIDGLPNIMLNGSDFMYNDQVMKTLSNITLGVHVISKVEQEICFRASSFMGSGESTWSLAMFRARLASRRWQKLMHSRPINQTSESAISQGLFNVDDYIIEELLQDPHATGLQCRYQSLYKRTHLKKEIPQESYQEEAPDTWLDMEACEAQLGQGGSCTLFNCF